MGLPSCKGRIGKNWEVLRARLGCTAPICLAVPTGAVSCTDTAPHWLEHPQGHGCRISLWHLSPAGCSLGRFPLDVEGPFNIIFFLFEHSCTFCPFGLLINVAVCFPFSQCVLPTNLIFPSDVESCRRTWKALSSHALPQTTPFPWGIPRLSTWDCDLGKPSSVMSEYLQCFSLFRT